MYTIALHIDLDLLKLHNMIIDLKLLLNLCKDVDLIGIFRFNIRYRLLYHMDILHRRRKFLDPEWHHVRYYGISQWHGDTRKSIYMKEGYKAVPEYTNCYYIRVVRGDNLCALRSTLIQFLRLYSPPMFDKNSAVGLVELISRMAYAKRDMFVSDPSPDFKEHALLCIDALHNIMSFVDGEADDDARIALLMDAFDSNPTVEFMVLDSLKLLMLAHAEVQYQIMIRDEEVYPFVPLLFARSTSKTPAAFFKNHLRDLGHSAGLEQVELNLLSLALKVRIMVVRLSAYKEPDFITTFHYRDGANHDKAIFLISEDDRHYNILK